MDMEVLLGLIVMIFGGGWVAHLGWERFQKRRRCREPITGVCKEVVTLPRSLNSYYDKVRFYYVYEGKKYETFAVDEMGGRKSSKFEPGKSYPLYINPDKPENIRCTKKVIRFDDWFCILFFGCFYVMGIIGAMVWGVQALLVLTNQI